MNVKNIERNQLDYILTDVLPTELSELFSYRYFYDYLNTKNKELSYIVKKIIKDKNDSKCLFCCSKNWVSMPLSYTIMKQLHSERTISLLQPISAIQLYVFICTFQKEILTLLQKNAVYSLRYHKKNNDLYYKCKNKSITKYFDDISVNAGKGIIEKTGIFFNIGPYKSISAFTSSEDWFVLNSKYKYFVRTDYKACFDSIYTHTFNWIIGKDVNDTKRFKNGSIYATIDRILMNINARTSNGIVVGPEFSRMVAEMLLQTIDRDVFCMLLNKGYILHENYNIYRFVDDIFIFTDSENLADEIIDLYSKAAGKYLLRLNESKLYKSKVPFVLDTWLNETNLFTNKASFLLFYSKDEQKVYLEEHKSLNDEQGIKPHLLKSRSLSLSKRNIMNQFGELICKYADKDKTIVSYFLGMILNKIGKSKEEARIFKENVTDNVVFDFLDLSFYFYSFFPNYNNTQKLLSVISYVKDEIDIFEKKEKLQKLIERYAFIFEKANLNDIVNLILFCHQAQIEIPFRQEEKIVEELTLKDDPVLWASYLLYSQYSPIYYQEIRNKIGKLLTERIDAIVDKDNCYTYREFWWPLIFNKSPHLQAAEQTKIDSIIPHVLGGTVDPNVIVGDIFAEFLVNSPNQFFEWDVKKTDFLRSITYKTRQRSIFKNYHDDLHSLYWGSI